VGLSAGSSRSIPIITIAANSTGTVLICSPRLPYAPALHPSLPPQPIRPPPPSTRLSIMPSSAQSTATSPMPPSGLTSGPFTGQPSKITSSQPLGPKPSHFNKPRNKV
jgi:hypothetical protein